MVLPFLARAAVGSKLRNSGKKKSAFKTVYDAGQKFDQHMKQLEEREKRARQQQQLHDNQNFYKKFK